MNNLPPYNTEQKRLVIAAYGRNIQNMIDYCVSLEDREERTRCAYAIAEAMARLFPENVRDGNDHQIWDHMYMMSDFQLDIDWPCEVVSREEAHPRPERVPYQTGNIRYRHYGSNLENMVRSVAEMPESPERNALVSMLANHMKKLLTAQYQDGVTDSKVFRDLQELSDGRISVNPDELHLYSYKMEPMQVGGKKKKKK